MNTSLINLAKFVFWVIGFISAVKLGYELKANQEGSDREAYLSLIVALITSALAILL